jgi:hypothetical protein
VEQHHREPLAGSLAGQREAAGARDLAEDLKRLWFHGAYTVKRG